MWLAITLKCVCVCVCVCVYGWGGGGAHCVSGEAGRCLGLNDNLSGVHKREILNGSYNKEISSRI